ncbi:unnamed protein product [Rotaria magnacalcarata]|uniref:Uncharacterized protein n=1 Tax=Rotaria magnacalcarata TaxID=392030 RepID=A0A816YRS4_9BILA|nr:unnamed protein product [Rotaria magnacalcarata]
MNRQSTKFQDTVLKDESSRSDSTKTTTGEELRTSTSNAVTNDALEPNPKGSSKAQQYRHERNDQSFLKTQKIGTWNVRSMNQGKLDIVKLEMERMKIDILGISELK